MKMKRDISAKEKEIKFLVMDVDGTLTDGKIYMGNTGELFKAFDVKDGCGIKDILPEYHIIPVVITARESEIVKRRCEELGIIDCYQGVREKVKKLEEVVSFYSLKEKVRYQLENVAYIGDDILDLPCIEIVKKSGGLTACPADAVERVKEIVDFATPHNGGCGAVRDVIEFIAQNSGMEILL